MYLIFLGVFNLTPNIDQVFHRWFQYASVCSEGVFLTGKGFVFPFSTVIMYTFRKEMKKEMYGWNHHYRNF